MSFKFGEEDFEGVDFYLQLMTRGKRLTILWIDRKWSSTSNLNGRLQSGGNFFPGTLSCIEQ